MVMKLVLVKESLKNMNQILHIILMISSFLTRNFGQENLLPVYLNEFSTLISSYAYIEGHRDGNEVSITVGTNKGDSKIHESQII